MRARAIVGRALDRAGVLDRLFWLRARLGQRGLAVLTYHRIGRAEDVGELDPGVLEATPEELEAQLDVLRTHATLISLADLRRAFRGRRLPPNPVLVTFDDGYADVLAHAVPILRRAGVPATCFVATAFPDGGRLFWWDRISLLMRRSARDRVELAYPAPLTLHPTRSPVAASRALCEVVKHTPRLDLGRLWEALEQATGVALDAAEERALAGRTIMGWSAVKRLRDAGMDVQSHSHDHFVLNALSPDVAQRDLARSVRVLREALGEEVYSVAYPVGYEIAGALRDALRDAPRESHFEIGFTNCTGLCALPLTDPLNVPRISMNLGIDPTTFKARLLLGEERQAKKASWTPSTPAAPPAPTPSERRAVEARGASRSA